MDYKIRDLLNMEIFKGAVYIGDKKQLSNKIKGITVIDSPEKTSFVRRGEVIFLCFYPIIKTMGKDEIIDWMNELADLKISGVIVTKDVNEVSEIVLSVCKNRNIPIIKVPKDIPSTEITSPVLEQLYNRGMEKFKYIKEVHHRFTELSFQGADSYTIIKTLEDLIGNPVTIYNESYQKVVSTNSDVELFIELSTTKEGKSKFDTKYPIYRRTVSFPKLNEKKSEQILIPIKIIDQAKINLVVHTINNKVDENSFIAIEYAANTLTLENVRKVAVAEMENKFKDALIDDIISAKAKSPASIYERAAVTSFDLEGKYAVVIFNLKPLQETHINNYRLFQKHYELLEKTIDSYYADALTRDRGDEIVVLWKVNDREDIDKSEIYNIKQTVEQICNQFKASVNNYAIQVGIGNIALSITEISKSYNEARDTLTIGKSSQHKDFIISFNELGIYRLLSKFDDVNELRDFIPSSLQKLLGYQKSNKDALLETLNVFLQCQQNIAKSAQLLLVHYKTVTYRLERIKEITGMNYDDHEEMLSVQVGLKIMDVIDTQE